MVDLCLVLTWMRLRTGGDNERDCMRCLLSVDRRQTERTRRLEVRGNQLYCKRAWQASRVNCPVIRGVLVSSEVLLLQR